MTKDGTMYEEELFDIVQDLDERRRIDCCVNYLDGMWRSEDTTSVVANLLTNKS